MVDVSDLNAVAVQLSVQLVDQLDVSSGSSDGDVVLVLDRRDLDFDVVDIVSILGNSGLQSSDGNQMHVKVSIVVVQVVLEGHDSVSQSVSHGVPVVNSVGPDGISSSVSGDSNLDVVDGNSVSVESDAVSLVRNSVSGDHMLLVSDGRLELGNS